MIENFNGLVYLFDKNCAEQNGWSKSNVSKTHIRVLGIICKSFIYMILACAFCLIPKIGVYFTIFVPFGWLVLLVYWVVKLLKDNDKYLNTAYTAFVYYEDFLYYVRYFAPGVQYETSELKDSIKKKSFFIKLLLEAINNQDKFQNTLLQIEFDHKAQIIRLDDVKVKSSKNGILTLSYKNHNRKTSKIEVADGYVGLQNDIEINKFSNHKNSNIHLDPFPKYLRPIGNDVVGLFMIILFIGVPMWLFVADIPFLGIYHQKTGIELIEEYLQDIEIEQTNVEDLVSQELLDEMIKEALTLDENIDFEFDHISLDKFGPFSNSNEEPCWWIIVYGKDKNTGESVTICFYEHNKGHYNSIPMSCTNKWDMMLVTP